jgi:hypothetical protein
MSQTELDAILGAQRQSLVLHGNPNCTRVALLWTGEDENFVAKGTKSGSDPNGTYLTFFGWPF